MRSPLPTPKFDLVSWGGGSFTPPLYKTLEFLKFECDYIQRTFRKNPFSKKRTELIHKHKECEGLVLIMYDYKEDIDILLNDELVYTVSGTFILNRKKTEILREISLSKLF